MQDHLEEVVVLPTPGNLQVPRCHSDLLEASLQKHPLRANVARQGAGLDACSPSSSRAVSTITRTAADASPRPVYALSPQ
jgi:hypothetical protein